MSLQWPDGADDGAERVWQRVLVPMAVEMRAGAGELAAQAVARMRTELPALFPDQQMVTEHLVSTEASLRQAAQVIEAGSDPRKVDLPPSTTGIARAAAQRQAPLADLLATGVGGPVRPIIAVVAENEPAAPKTRKAK
ncbi:MAG TPA: hypothetical protein PLI79_12385 [Mycobacterium sp.]|nr:hypothetical protein [Mycobacterium sp.]